MIRQDRPHPTRLPVVQPGPLLHEHRAGPLRTAAAVLGGTVVVILVLYGLAQPPQPEQASNAPATQASSPGTPAASGQQAAVPPQNANKATANASGKAAPSTTGQGSASQNAQQPGKAPGSDRATADKPTDRATEPTKP